MSKIYVDPLSQKCCEVEPEPCVIPKCTCGNRFKEEYEEYLRQEACKVEPDPEYSMCDYDPNQVYFLQYRKIDKKDVKKKY